MRRSSCLAPIRRSFPYIRSILSCISSCPLQLPGPWSSALLISMALRGGSILLLSLVRAKLSSSPSVTLWRISKEAPGYFWPSICIPLWIFSKGRSIGLLITLRLAATADCEGFLQWNNGFIGRFQSLSGSVVKSNSSFSWSNTESSLCPKSVATKAFPMTNPLLCKPISRLP